MVQAALGSRRIAPLQKRGRRIDIGRRIVRIEFENPVEKAVVARGIGSIRRRDAVQFHLRKFLGRMFGHGERLLESIITQIVTHLIVHVAELREDIGQQPLPRPARRPERLFLSVGRQRPSMIRSTRSRSGRSLSSTNWRRPLQSSPTELTRKIPSGSA